MDELFEKRKKIIYEFICDEFYVPMKLKELSMLLQVPKDQKGELKAVMDTGGDWISHHMEISVMRSARRRFAG